MRGLTLRSFIVSFPGLLLLFSLLSVVEDLADRLELPVDLLALGMSNSGSSVGLAGRSGISNKPTRSTSSKGASDCLGRRLLVGGVLPSGAVDAGRLCLALLPLAALTWEAEMPPVDFRPERRLALLTGLCDTDRRLSFALEG